MAKAESRHQRLPSHTNQGLVYSSLARTLLLAGAFLAFAVSLPLGVGWFGLIVLILGSVAALPAFSNRLIVYMSMAEVFKNRVLRTKRGRLGNSRVSTIIFEGDRHGERHQSEDVQVNFLPIDEAGLNYLSEIVTPNNGQHTLYVLFDQWGELKYGDPETVLALTDRFTDICKSLAKSYGPNLGISMFMTRVPVDPTEGMAYLSQNKYLRSEGDNQATLQLLEQNWMESLELINRNSGQIIAGMSITVYRPRSWSSLRPEKLQISDIISSDAWQLSEQLIALLKSVGVSGVRRPDPYEMAILLRGTLDIANMPELYRDMYADRLMVGSHGFDVINDSQLLSKGVLPQSDELVAKRDHLQVSGRSLTRTLYCPTFERRSIPAGFVMSELYDLPPNIWAGVTLKYRTSDAKTEVRRQKVRRRTAEAKRFRRDRQGITSTAAELDLEAQLIEDDSSLYFSQGDVLKLHLLATVSSDNINRLDDATTALTNHFRASAFPLRVLSGDVAQWPGRLETLGIPTSV